MKFAYDVPGYVCGFRFSDDRRYYDSTNTRFIDLSGYGNHCDVQTGSPSFSNLGTYSREGLLLDNSCQLELDNPIAWEGTTLIVARAHLPTVSERLTTWIFGDDFTGWSSNALVAYLNSGGTVTLTAAGTSSTIFKTENVTNDAIVVFASAWDQETRKIYTTLDAVTVNESAAAAGVANGFPVAPGAYGNVGLAGSVGSRKIRIGNNACAVAPTTVADATDYLHVFEQHFWKGNVLRNNLPDVLEFVTSLKTYYGVS